MAYKLFADYVLAVLLAFIVVCCCNCCVLLCLFLCLIYCPFDFGALFVLCLVYDCLFNLVSSGWCLWFSLFVVALCGWFVVINVYGYVCGLLFVLCLDVSLVI